MEREATLKYSLAVILGVFLIFNAVLVLFAAQGRPLIGAQETIPIGIKWLILMLITVASVGIAFWLHRAFVEGGVSPVDTTWVDFVVIAFALLTMFALLFIGEAYWALFAFFLLLLFIFTALVLKRFLSSGNGWLGWLIGTILLVVLVVIFISTLFPPT
jgi:hypothetical protein